MATKFTESTLALKIRQKSEQGEIAGGPMYTLLHGLDMKRMAAMFALFAMIASFGIGNLVQVNSVVDGLVFMSPAIKDYTWLVGVIMSLIVGMVILGGVKRIAKVASTIVPFMALAYISVAFVVLLMNFDAIPAALLTILNHALNPWAVGGAAVGEAIRWGVARGLFSNEAGLGSSPMAHAAARTNEPVREGLVAMLEPFIDTLVICTMTGLVIVITGVYDNPLHADLIKQEKGAVLNTLALQAAGWIRPWIPCLAVFLFAYSTMSHWSYYGER